MGVLLVFTFGGPMKVRVRATRLAGACFNRSSAGRPTPEQRRLFPLLETLLRSFPFALVDTVALIEALNREIVAGAGLDVLEEESVMRKDVMKSITERIIKRLQTTSSEESSLKYPEQIKRLQTLMD